MSLLQFLVLVIFGLKSILAQKKLDCNISQSGTSAVLNCVLPCEEVSISYLRWKKNNVDLLIFYKKEFTYSERDRIGFKQHSWDKSSPDISLQIKNMSPEDKGEYSYYVISDCGTFEDNLTVNIPDTTTPPNETKTQEPGTTAPPIEIKTQPEKHTGDEHPSRTWTVAGISIVFVVLLAAVLYKTKVVSQKLNNCNTMYRRHTIPTDENTTKELV